MASEHKGGKTRSSSLSSVPSRSDLSDPAILDQVLQPPLAQPQGVRETPLIVPIEPEVVIARPQTRRMRGEFEGDIPLDQLAGRVDIGTLPAGHGLYDDTKEPPFGVDAFGVPKGSTDQTRPLFDVTRGRRNSGRRDRSRRRDSSAHSGDSRSSRNAHGREGRGRRRTSWERSHHYVGVEGEFGENNSDHHRSVTPYTAESIGGG